MGLQATAQEQQERLLQAHGAEKAKRKNTTLSVDTRLLAAADDGLEIISPKRKPDELRHLQDESKEPDQEVLDVLGATLVRGESKFWPAEVEASSLPSAGEPERKAEEEAAETAAAEAERK